MSKHIFNLRMISTYLQPENSVATLNVEALIDNVWTALDLDTRTPGFLVYVYSILTCQHTFLRTNATELNLTLTYSQGSILVETSEDWIMEKVIVQFDVTLADGDASEDDIDHIVASMNQCPVSKNLPQNIDTRTRVGFQHDKR